MQDLVRQFEPRTKIQESRTEIVVGEVIRAMARLGFPTIRFHIHDTRQEVRFRTVGHTHISTVAVTVERPTRSEAPSTTLFDEQVRLHVVAELRQAMRTPSELLAAARFPVEGRTTSDGVHVEQDRSSMVASIVRDIDIGGWMDVPHAESPPLVELMDEVIAILSGAIAAHQ